MKTIVSTLQEMVHEYFGAFFPKVNSSLIKKKKVRNFGLHDRRTPTVPPWQWVLHTDSTAPLEHLAGGWSVRDNAALKEELSRQV